MGKPIKYWEDLWKAEVWNRANDVDPDASLHWLALCTGWAIGKGVPPAKARRFATFIRYETKLG